MDSFSSGIVILLMAIIPSFGWVMVYRWLDSRDPEPSLSLITAMVFGVLSTLPVFGLQYVFSSYPDLDLIAVLQTNLTNPLVFTAFFLLFVAGVEEFVKAMAFLLVSRKCRPDFNQVVDGIVYAALIGIGFALAENIYYFSRAAQSFEFGGNFFAIFAIRSFGTMLAHTLFTGVFGYFFALSYFDPFISEDSRQEKFWRNLHKNVKKALRLRITFHHLLPQVNDQPITVERNVMLIEGYLVAVMLHFLYNGMIKLELFGQNWTFLIVPLLFVMAWFVWSRFFVPLYVRIIDLIRIRKNEFKLKIH